MCNLDMYVHSMCKLLMYTVEHLFCLGGYYSEKLLNREGFRILVLNTNLHYARNEQTQNMADPVGQFNWADQVLTEAGNNKERVNLLFSVWNPKQCSIYN